MVLSLYLDLVYEMRLKIVFLARSPITYHQNSDQNMR